MKVYVGNLSKQVTGQALKVNEARPRKDVARF